MKKIAQCEISWVTFEIEIIQKVYVREKLYQSFDAAGYTILKNEATS